MKRIEKLLPLALQAIRKELVKSDGLSVREEYDGYVASFAPSVRTANLLPTLSFYTDIHKVEEKSENKGHDGRDPRRCHVTAAMYRIIKKEIEQEVKLDDLLYYALEKTYGSDLRNTPAFPAHSKRPPEDLRQEIMDAAIALKLALRNFKQVPK
jgi:CRISPR/Cas system CMR-associated protein Cmr5 small subunit